MKYYYYASFKLVFFIVVIPGTCGASNKMATVRGISKIQEGGDSPSTAHYHIDGIEVLESVIL